MEGRREGWEGKKGLGMINNGRKGSRKNKDRRGKKEAKHSSKGQGRDGMGQGQSDGSRDGIKGPKWKVRE